MFKLIPLSWLVVTLTFAEVQPKNPSPPSDTVVISASGKKRIREQFKKIEQTLKEANRNLENSQQNSSTILSDIKELSELEDEYLELQKRFHEYVVKANKEIQVNEKAMVEIEKYEKKILQVSKGNPEGAQQKLYEDAKQERLDRLRWKSDANSNLQRANTLLSQLQTSLKDIKLRNTPLRDELRAWNRKQDDYQKLASEIRNQKSSLEKSYGRYLASDLDED